MTATNSMSGQGVTVRHDPSAIVVAGARYRLEVDSRRPRARLVDVHDGDGSVGAVWSTLSLVAGLDLVGGRDESYDISPARVVTETPDAVELVVESASPVWSRKAVHVRCTAAAVELWATASGPAGPDARLGEVTVLGGRAILPSGAAGTFRSSIGFASLFSPTPTEPVHVVRPSAVPSSLGVVGDAEPGRLHGIFSPPPLCWALGDAVPTGPTDVPSGRWWGLSMCAPVDELTMTAVRYEPLDGGFLVRLDYEGHTRVGTSTDGGVVRTPSMVLRPADTPERALADYRDDLVNRGSAPPSPDPSAAPAWWSEPIFCGWGAQCARAAMANTATEESTAGLVGSAPVISAAQLARQDVYDEFLTTMAAAGIDPGTIVIDDRWQAEYATAEADRQHWPDLREWIARQHAAGRRVLLWWKAWDPGGLPVEECVTDAGGRPVAVDVASPAYRARLARIVAGLVGPDGLDADGFKVDFTQRAPSGESLRATDGPWGIAALYTLLKTMFDAAKQAKSEALIVTHTPHPSFGDVCDMVRLNDVLERDTAGDSVGVVEQLRFRHAVAAHSLPGHLVDTDQWPIPDRASWRDYVAAQAELGGSGTAPAVPALYYLEAIDGSRERLEADDHALVARTWAEYRARRDAHRARATEAGA